MKVLHIIRKKGEGFPRDVISEHRKTEKVSVLLVQDAVFLFAGLRDGAGPGMATYACKDDLVARGMDPGPGALSYQEMVSLIWENDRVVCW